MIFLSGGFFIVFLFCFFLGGGLEWGIKTKLLERSFPTSTMLCK